MTNEVSRALAADQPLESWKEIAAYLKRDIRTAKRWEKFEDLPVHRHLHKSRSSVYAWPSELDAWRAAREPSTVPKPVPLWHRPLPSAALAGVIVLSLLMASSGPYNSQAMAAGGPKITIRRVWDGPGRFAWQGAPSPDGRYLTFVDWEGDGDLILRDLETGETRTLAREMVTDRFAGSSVWSPDGKQVAYAMYVADGFEEIRVVEVDGGEPRAVYSDPGNSASPVAWFPDGESLLATSPTKDRRGGIVRISLSGGSARVLKRFDWPFHRLGAVSLSPDGNYVAYDFPAAKDSAQRDIYQLAADGSSEGVLVAHPANDELLGWTPDGRILFLSDRTGAQDIWMLEVEDGRAMGEPEILKRDVGIIRPVGFSASGAFFYFREAEMHDVYVAEVDLDAGSVLSAPARVTESFLGSTAHPAWSSDGRQIAYVVHKGPLYAQLEDDRIRIRTLGTGEERELAPSFGFQTFRLRTPVWSPDGSFLLVCGEKDRVSQACYLVDVVSGARSTIFEGNQLQIICGRVWSRDGKSIFYASRYRDSTGYHGDIVKRDLQTGEEKTLYSLATFHNPIFLAISPDGSQLAFALAYVREDDQYLPHTIMVIPSDGGEAREVARIETTDEIAAGALVWTSDGRSVIYGTSSGPDWLEVKFWKVSSKGGEPEVLFSLPSASFIQLHPDGRQLAFTANQPGAEIWVMENYLLEPPVAE